MPNAVVSDSKPLGLKANSSQISWLALTLTPGLGPTRAKRLVDFFGNVESVFNASLTELEAAGLPVQSAQSLGTGRSVELSHDEAAKASAAGVQIVALDDAEYPSRLRQIYDRPLVLYVRGNVAALSQALRWLELGIPPLMALEWLSAWRVIFQLVGWSSLAAWLVA